MRAQSLRSKLFLLVLLLALVLPTYPVGNVTAQELASAPANLNTLPLAYTLQPGAAGLIPSFQLSTTVPLTGTLPVDAEGMGEAFGPEALSSPPLAVPGLALSVRVSPDLIPTGQVATIDVRLANEGQAAVHGVVVSGTLPLGLDCPACGDFFDPPARRLQWRLPVLEAGQVLTRTLTMPVLAEAGWEGGVPLALSVTAVDAPGVTRGSGVVRTPYPIADGPTAAVLRPGQGGQVVSPDGRLTVTFPPETVGITLTAGYSPSAVLENGYFHPLRTFSVVVRDAAGQEVHQFPAPIQVAYRYTWAEALGRRPEELFLARWDEEQQAWVRLPSQVDADNRLLVGTTDHFSTLGGGYFQLPSDDYMPQLQGFQEISLFTGVSSFSYPIQVPPGRGNLIPQLSLSYSSGSVDWPARANDPDVQAGWAGYGWSLDPVGFIGRSNVGGFVVDTGTCEQTGTSFSRGDVYNIVLNGASYDLVKDASGAYHTAEETYWKVTTGTWHSYGPDEWYIRTKDGTLYTFSVVLFQFSGTTTPCVDGAKQAYKWLLTQAQDMHGNTISYEYAYESPYTCQSTPTYKAVYPLRITYNGGLTKIEFNRTARTDLYAPNSTTRYPGKFQQNTKLDWIGVYMSVSGSWQLVRKYQLGYDYSTYDDDLGDGVEQAKLTLTSIQQCGMDGTTCLPATTFDYYPMGTVLNPQIGRNRLWTVANGHGGQQTLVYEVVTEVNASRNRVASRTVADGLAGDEHSGTWYYDYSTAQLNSPNKAGVCAGNSDDAATMYPRARQEQEFRGHQMVTVTDPNGNVQVHWFYLDDVQKGKEQEVQYKDGSGTIYRDVVNSYAYDTIAANTDQGGYTFVTPELYFLYQSQVQDRSCTDVSCSTYKEHKTVYEYDASMQGGAQYGNQTTVREYAENGTLYRTSRKWYCPNPTAWIVDKKNAEAVYAGDWGAQATQAWYYYDQVTDHRTCPTTLGELKLMKKMNLASQDATWKYWDTVETESGYDSYGNVTSATTYSDYGLVQQGVADPNNIVSTRPTQARTTAINYNYSGLGYHLYPERVTYPVGSPALAETAAYDYQRGVITSYMDMNNNVTTYQYDPLGRVTRVIKPGDSETYWTTRIDYVSFGTVGQQRVTVYRREVSGASGNLWTETFFDGLGRTVQTHAEDSGQEVRQSTAYDMLGQKTTEWMAYYGTHGQDGGYGAYGYVPPDADGARARYSYDALGRAYDTTNPDGTVVSTRYSEWQTAAIDENDHLKISRTDAQGRLSWVKEYDESFAGELNWSTIPVAYATTDYGYDVRDELTTVQDADLPRNTTTLSYNMLGQKTGMNDPDMGSWSYGYNAVGSLVRQVDAKSQITCLYYDAMDRPLGKDYISSGSCPGTPSYDVSYTYDAGTNGKGQRTGMSDGSGSTNWSYDARGRLAREDKVITGSGTFVTQWSYDAMDRLAAMRYPQNNAGGTSGELVTYGYNTRGLLNSVSGTSTYVVSTSYDAAGRVDLRTLISNVLQTDYNYYLWTDANGRGRLQWLKSGDPDGDVTALQYLAYTYDAVGNVGTIKDYKDYIPGTTTYQQQTFTYDFLNRLLTAQASGGTYGNYGLESYTYTGNDGKIGNLTSKAGVSYTYGTQAPSCPDGALPKVHAVVTAGTNTYCYDRNGNQVKRVVSGSTYNLAYNTENRLTGLSGGATATFIYDGDGNRVKGTTGGVTTAYLGNYLEWTSSTMKKYYYAGSVRVAMRTGSSTVQYLLGDHLGSQAITANTSGGKDAEVRYEAWGEDRYTNGTTPTSFRFTGQRSEMSSIGLYYYGARWYDPYLARWIQPDTIIPDSGNPQSFNRLSYVLNNALKYVDPSGHTEEETDSADSEIEAAIIKWGYEQEITNYLLTMFRLGGSQLTETIMAIYQANLNPDTFLQIQWGEMKSNYAGGYDPKTRTLTLNSVHREAITRDTGRNSDPVEVEPKYSQADWADTIAHEVNHMVTLDNGQRPSRENEYYAMRAGETARYELTGERPKGGALDVDAVTWIYNPRVLATSYGHLPAWNDPNTPWFGTRR